MDTPPVVRLRVPLSPRPSPCPSQTYSDSYVRPLPFPGRLTGRDPAGTPAEAPQKMDWQDDPALEGVGRPRRPPRPSFRPRLTIRPWRWARGGTGGAGSGRAGVLSFPGFWLRVSARGPSRPLSPSFFQIPGGDTSRGGWGRRWRSVVGRAGFPALEDPARPPRPTPPMWPSPPPYPLRTPRRPPQTPSIHLQVVLDKRAARTSALGPPDLGRGRRAARTPAHRPVPPS